MYSKYIQSNSKKIDFRKCGYLINGISIVIHRDYQMIYRDILNYASVVMKNKSRNYFKKSKNLYDNFDNNFSESNSINESNNLNNKDLSKNSNRIYSSNELSFLIYSSNKDTNKFKRDVLFGNLSSLSKEKDKLRFNSLIKESIKNSNSFKNSNIYRVLENNIKKNSKDKLSLTGYLTSEKNKINTDFHNLLRNKIFNTTIKKDYNNLFDNENNFSLNDYLNLEQNNENIDNNDANNDYSSQENHSPNNLNDFDQYKNSSNTPDVSSESDHNLNNKKNLDEITDEKINKKKNTIILNEELFNSRIKNKISKIKDDIIINNNLKTIKGRNGANIKSSKYINSKLKIDEDIDYYELMSKNLEEMDESKILEKIFSEYFSEIKFKYWMNNSFKNFINSLNNCRLYDLIKLRKENNNSNIFDTLMSNMELSNNKYLSNTNSSLYNSKSELLRNGSNSINESQSSQTIENPVEKSFPLISKFPKLMVPQSIIPEESSNFLYSNNDYVLNRSLGEPVEDNNNLMEVEECDEGKDYLYEENIKKELNNIGNNKEININIIFENLKLNNTFEDKEIKNENTIKEFKTNIFYDILSIAQNENMNICQKKPFGKIIKVK